MSNKVLTGNIGLSAFTYEQYIELFKSLMDFLRSIKVSKSFAEIESISSEYKRKLHQVLDSGFNENDPYSTPFLKYWIGESKISDTPLPGEQKLFDHMLRYLCDYYGIKFNKSTLEELFVRASTNPNDILSNEAYYEIHQCFSAFGHSTVRGVQANRLKKLGYYADKKVYKPNLRVLYESILFVAKDSLVSAHVIDSVKKGHMSSDPFQSKGARNVGTPYWSRTTLQNGKSGKTYEELVFSLANDLYKRYNLVDNIDKYVSIPATLFGRSQTKGILYDYNGNWPVIKGFDAAGRPIYGISLVSNVNIARLYYSIMQEEKNKLYFYPLRGSQALRDMLPRLAKFDATNKLYRISNDMSRYDTTQSAEQLVNCAIIDLLAFGHTKKNREIILYNLAVEVLTPIYYKTKRGGPLKMQFTFGGHKSGLYTTLEYGSKVGRLYIVYAMLHTDRDWFYKTFRQYQSAQLPFMMTVGDDWSFVCKDKGHAEEALDIITNDFGLLSNTSKSAFGTWIVQYGANSIGGASYPLARSIRSFYYPERDPAPKPPLVLLMTAYSAIDNMWESPHCDYFIREHVLKTDKYAGGTCNEDGKPITFHQFYKTFVIQQQDYAKTGGSVISSDYRTQDILKDDGTVKSEWLERIWNRINKLRY